VVGVCLAELSFNHTLNFNSTHWTESLSGLVNVIVEVIYSFTMPSLDSEVPALIHRYHAALYKELIGDDSVELGFAWLGQPSGAVEYPGISLAVFIAPWAVPSMFAFCFIAFCYALVKEKAERMRLVGAMSGLGALPYWAINWLYNYVLFLLQLIIVLICSYTIMGGFAYFTDHDFSLLLVFYLLFGAAMNSFTCAASTFFNDPMIAFLVMALVTFFLGPLVGYVSADNALIAGTPDSGKMMAIMLLPNLALSNGVNLLVATTGDAVGRGGRALTWSNIAAGSEAPLASVLLMLVVDFILYTCLFLYLDAVLPFGPGVKEHPLFCLHALTQRRPKKTRVTSTDGAAAGVELSSLAKRPERDEPTDVQGERTRVLQSQAGGIRAIGLSKTYPRCKEPAVVNVQFGIKRGECFGLLGSNGAGKSTVIHMLCGLHAPSSGTMLAGDEGYDLRYDLRKIQSAMGTCAQDNLLWDELTGPEHLKFFAGLRRVAKKDIKAHIDFWLKRVGLNSIGDRKKRSRAYSGGMKRRLSVATAFIGNPQIVYLDEPSTGLDPQSRRALWHAVRTAQAGKSIVLTTHALDEAQELCARVAIMGFGLVRTIGTPADLRMRFNEGLKFIVSVHDESQRAAMDAFVMGLGDGLIQRDAIACTATYEIPQGAVAMSHLFASMQKNKERLHIADWGITHPSLEAVFLQVVAQTAAEKKDTKRGEHVTPARSNFNAQVLEHMAKSHSSHA